MSRSPHTPVSHAATLGKGIMASRLSGFVRDAAFAALLGGGGLGDAFLAAFRIPNFVRRLLAEGGLAHTLVPAFGSVENDPDRAASLLKTTLAVLTGFACVAALAIAFFSHQIMVWLAPGFAQSGPKISLAGDYLALCTAYLPLAVVSAVIAAALMARGRFLVPALAALILNAALILAAVVAWLIFGAGDFRCGYVLCAGLAVAGAAQWLVQARDLPDELGCRQGRLRPQDPVFRDSMVRLPGFALASSANQVNILLATVLASLLAEGSVSALYFAERVVEFPLGVIGVSFGLASLADLSGETARDPAVVSSRLSASVRITLFLALPAAVGTALLAHPICGLLFGHGQFSAEALQRTSQAVTAYAFGLPVLAACRPLLAGLAATGQTGTAARAALWGAAATVGGGTALLPLSGSWGPALAVSLAAWLTGALLVRGLTSRSVRVLPGLLWSVKVLAACGVMAAFVGMVTVMAQGNAARVCLGVPLGVAVYFGSARVLRIGETATVLALVRGFRGDGKLDISPSAGQKEPGGATKKAP